MMKFDDLPVHVRQEVENALLPGEDVRYVSRPKTCFAEVLLRGEWALFAFSLFWNLFVLIFVAFVVWQVLEGTKPLIFLISVYAGLLIFALAGWLLVRLSTSDVRYLRAAWYLVTTRRVMILRPGNMLISRPLSAELISHVEVRPDGSGFLYFGSGKKKDELLVDESFAFIPEVRRVEALINELAAQVPPMPEEKWPAPDWGILEPACLSRLQEELEPGEQVQWIGCSMPVRQTLSPLTRCRYGAWTLVNLLGVVCAVHSAAEKLGILVLGALYLVIAACFLLLLFASERSVYAITNKRVCDISPKKVRSFLRRVTAIEHHPCGAVSISLKTRGEMPEDMELLSSTLPAVILLSNQFPEEK